MPHQVGTSYRELFCWPRTTFVAVGCALSRSDTVFNRVGAVNGLEAWKILIRHVNHWCHIRFVPLRWTVAQIHINPAERLDELAELIVG